MKKFALFASIILLVFLGFKLTKTSEASDFTDCSSISGYRLTQGASCETLAYNSTVFNFRAKDPDGNNLTWSIDYGDGAGGGFGFSCPARFPNNSLSVNHTWNKPGIYEVKLAVSNCKGGIASASFNVIVKTTQDSNMSMPTVNIHSYPDSIYIGDKTTIMWDTTGIIEGEGSCTAPWITKAPYGNNPGGIEIVSPKSNTTYSITCKNPWGSASASTFVNVVDPSKKPTVTFSISPINTVVGGSVTANWSSTDATSCTAGLDNPGFSTDPLYNTWYGSRAVSGEEVIKYDLAKQHFNFPVPGSYGFNITCKGPGGSASSKVAVTVDSSLNCTKKAWYLDKDGDGYGTGTPIMACDKPTSKYVDNNTDCYDEPYSKNPTTGLLTVPTNAKYAFPGSTYSSASDRGDGSFDYNCDGVETKKSLYDTEHNGVTFYTIPSGAKKLVSSYYIVSTYTLNEWLDWSGHRNYVRDQILYLPDYLKYKEKMGTCQPLSTLPGDEAYVSDNAIPWICSFETSQCRGVDAATLKRWTYSDNKCTASDAKSLYPAHVCAAKCN